MQLVIQVAAEKIGSCWLDRDLPAAFSCSATAECMLMFLSEHIITEEIGSCYKSGYPGAF